MTISGSAFKRWSHPSWVRGLKLNDNLPSHLQRVAPFMGAWIETPTSHLISSGWKSHPSWVRGLKLLGSSRFSPAWPSHPSWVRGLKLSMSSLSSLNVLSHPSWVRGLKLRRGPLPIHTLCVAPFMGAWIETLHS